MRGPSPDPAPTGSREDRRPEPGGGAGLGDVSMSYANREASRPTGVRQPIGRWERSPAAAGGNKDPGAGTAGRVSGRRTPWAEAGRDSPGGGGGAAGGVALR